MKKGLHLITKNVSRNVRKLSPYTKGETLPILRPVFFPPSTFLNSIEAIREKIDSLDDTISYCLLKEEKRILKSYNAPNNQPLLLFVMKKRNAANCAKQTPPQFQFTNQTQIISDPSMTNIDKIKRIYATTVNLSGKNILYFLRSMAIKARQTWWNSCYSYMCLSSQKFQQFCAYASSILDERSFLHAIYHEQPLTDSGYAYHVERLRKLQINLKQLPYLRAILFSLPSKDAIVTLWNLRKETKELIYLIDQHISNFDPNLFIGEIYTEPKQKTWQDWNEHWFKNKFALFGGLFTVYAVTKKWRAKKKEKREQEKLEKIIQTVIDCNNVHATKAISDKNSV
ncbi:MAG: hypothetical protein WBQ73_01900 [Candidatus Babeliales bacterium]